MQALLDLGATWGEGPLDPLTQATYYKQHDVVVVLSRHSEQARTRALCGAAYNGDAATVNSLLQQGADVHATHEGSTALGHCVRYFGDGETVRLLLAAGASPDTIAWGAPVVVRGAEGEDAGVVQALLDGGADPDAVGPEKETALHAAVRRKHKENVRRLLAAGAAPNARMKGRRTPLHVAARTPDVDAEIADLLVGAGGAVDARDGLGLTPLLSTVAGATNTPLFRALLRLGADPRVTDRKKQTALMLCVKAHGHAGELIGPLLAGGVDIDARGPNQETAVMIACRSKSDYAMSLLIEAGADLSLRNDAGESLLAIARARPCSRYYLAMIEDAGALE